MDSNIMRDRPTPLKVSLLSVSAHNQAILEFFFAGAGKNLFEVTTAEQADAWLVDFDHLQGKTDWQRANSQLPKPAIALSVHELTLPNIVWVPKPLTSQSLTHAAIRVRSLLTDTLQLPEKESNTGTEHTQATSSMVSMATPATPTNTPESPAEHALASRPLPQKSFGFSAIDQQETPAPALPTAVKSSDKRLINAVFTDVATATKTASMVQVNLSALNTANTTEQAAPNTSPAIQTPQTTAEFAQETIDGQALLPVNPIALLQYQQKQRWQTLFNDIIPISATHPPKHKQDFTAEHYFLQHILKGWQLGKDDQQPVQVSIGQQDYLILFPENALVYSTFNLYEAAFAQLCQATLKSGYVTLSQPNTETLNTLLSVNKLYHYESEALLWTASLLTTQGRLIQNNNPKHPVYLMHWPNLTRLEAIPHGMRIAALWHHNPNTIQQIAKQLSISQTYVIAFYTASHALGLISNDTENIIKRPQNAASQQNRGLFSRLLKRLLGGSRNP